ncbi:hypothetical protein CSUI_009651, partial [Cystoisospora suis]
MDSLSKSRARLLSRQENKKEEEEERWCFTSPRLACCSPNLTQLRNLSVLEHATTPIHTPSLSSSSSSSSRCRSSASSSPSSSSFFRVPHPSLEEGKVSFTHSFSPLSFWRAAERQVEDLRRRLSKRLDFLRGRRRRKFTPLLSHALVFSEDPVLRLPMLLSSLGISHIHLVTINQEASRHATSLAKTFSIDAKISVFSGLEQLFDHWCALKTKCLDAHYKNASSSSLSCSISDDEKVSSLVHSPSKASSFSSSGRREEKKQERKEDSPSFLNAVNTPEISRKSDMPCSDQPEKKPFKCSANPPERKLLCDSRQHVYTPRDGVKGGDGCTPEDGQHTSGVCTPNGGVTVKGGVYTPGRSCCSSSGVHGHHAPEGDICLGNSPCNFVEKEKETQTSRRGGEQDTSSDGLLSQELSDLDSFTKEGEKREKERGLVISSSLSSFSSSVSHFRVLPVSLLGEKKNMNREIQREKEGPKVELSGGRSTVHTPDKIAGMQSVPSTRIEKSLQASGKGEEEKEREVVRFVEEEKEEPESKRRRFFSTTSHVHAEGEKWSDGEEEDERRRMMVERRRKSMRFNGEKKALENKAKRERSDKNTEGVVEEKKRKGTYSSRNTSWDRLSLLLRRRIERKKRKVKKRKKKKKKERKQIEGAAIVTFEENLEESYMTHKEEEEERKGKVQKEEEVERKGKVQKGEEEEERIYEDRYKDSMQSDDLVLHLRHSSSSSLMGEGQAISQPCLIEEEEEEKEDRDKQAKSPHLSEVLRPKRSLNGKSSSASREIEEDKEEELEVRGGSQEKEEKKDIRGEPSSTEGRKKKKKKRLGWSGTNATGQRRRRLQRLREKEANEEKKKMKIKKEKEEKEKEKEHGEGTGDHTEICQGSTDQVVKEETAEREEEEEEKKRRTADDYLWNCPSIWRRKDRRVQESVKMKLLHEKEEEEALRWRNWAMRRLVEEFWVYVHLHRYRIVVLDDASHVGYFASSKGLNLLTSFLQQNS